MDQIIQTMCYLIFKIEDFHLSRELYENYIFFEVVSRLCCRAQKRESLAVDFETVLAPSM